MHGNATSKPSLHVVGVGGTLRDNSTSLFALKRALNAAASTGATTELLDLRKVDLPMYQPDKSLGQYLTNVSHYIESIRQADAMIWSTAAYHGTLAGVTKNAIDFLQLLSGGEKPYLQDKVVALIATAGGDMAAVNAANSMVHAVHALRGTTIPLLVAIPKTWSVCNPSEGYIEPKWQERLNELGRLVVKTAASLRGVFVHQLLQHTPQTSFS